MVKLSKLIWHYIISCKRQPKDASSFGILNLVQMTNNYNVISEAPSKDADIFIQSERF